MIEGKLRTGLAGLILAIVTLVAVTGARAQWGEVWYVFVNTSSKPSVLAVANLGFERSGWARLSSSLESEELAWQVACDRHRTRQYYSPDIALGNVVCTGGRGSRVGQSRPGRADPEPAPASPPPRAKAPDYSCRDNGFVGRWSSTESPDTQLWLVEPGRIEGDYGSGRRIEGRLEGCILTGEWIEADGARGSLEFILAEDGQTFTGVHRERGGRSERVWRGRKLSRNVTKNQ